MRKVRLYLCCLFLMGASSAFSAAPIFHALIAEKWIEIFNDVDESARSDFIAGTLFPDIRYLGTIRREETHETGVTLDDILQTTDVFEKGKRLHVWVDETRCRLIKELRIMDQLVSVPKEHKVTFLKLLEDEILCQENDWTYICYDLDQFVPKMGYDYQVLKRTLIQWNVLLKFYFRHTPSELLARFSLSNQGILTIPPYLIQQWSDLIVRLSNEAFVQSYMLNMLLGFELLLRQMEHKFD